MSSIKQFSAVLLSLSFMTAVFSTDAMAQVGVRSAGHGVKCVQRLVPQADGTSVFTWYCAKTH